MVSKDVLSFLWNSPSFIVTTHRACDGDGLGAGLALCHGLRKIKKEALFLALDSPHSKYNFLDKDGLLKVWGGEKDLLTADKALVVVDANDYRLSEPLYSLARKNGLKVCFIDHHPLIQEPEGDLVCINTKASSTAEIVHSILKSMGIPLDEKIASALFTSIVFDTCRFRDIKNSPLPFAIASECVPYIRDVNFIYESLFKTLTARNLTFMSNLQNMEYYSNNKIAFLFLKEKDFTALGAEITQAYDLMELTRNVASIEASALVVEREDGSFKLSLRASEKDLIPLAKSFGGGGHRHSAGATVTALSLKDIKDRVLSYLSGDSRQAA